MIRKEFLDCFRIFLLINLGHESMLFKQGFPKDIWISSITQPGEHPNFGLEEACISTVKYFVSRTIRQISSS